MFLEKLLSALPRIIRETAAKHPNNLLFRDLAKLPPEEFALRHHADSITPTPHQNKEDAE